MSTIAAEKVGNNRIPSLDGIRGISIALVIVAHFLHTLDLKDLNIGYLGVRVFFILSGFLITGLLIRELDKSGTIRITKFYYRRTLRIFPPYYFYLLIVLLLSFVLGNSGEGSFLPAFAYLSNYLDPGRWDLGHTWSLSVEEQFYLLFPGLLLLLGKRKGVVVLIVLVALSPLIRIVDFRIFGDARWTTMGFHSNADALAVGCLFALLRPALHGNSIYMRAVRSKLIVLAPLAALLLNNQADHPMIFAVTASAVNILVALCMDWAMLNHDRSKIGWILNSSPLAGLGVMSYSIYLWQQLFLDPYSQYRFTKFPLNLICIAVCSCLSYFAVERFSLRLRQRWEKRIFVSKTTSPDAKNSNLPYRADVIRNDTIDG